MNAENSPQHISSALSRGYEVEIDVWFVNDSFYLGHDEPLYLVDEEFLENEKFWCHAKNEESFHKMLSNPKIHCFWHQTDDYTLTSKGIPWVFPGKKVYENAIWVLSEKTTYKNIMLNCLGICSDNILRYK